MTRLPLQFLPAFRAAAELENLRAAATLMNVTPSAISQQIGTLEEQLGFTLFERQGRHVLLNAAGKVFLRSVQAALAELDAGVKAAQAGEGVDGDTVLRITVVPSFAQRWLLPRIGRWRERHPDIRLDIDATRQNRDLSRQEAHVGIRFGSGHWAGLEAESLSDGDIPLIVVGSRNAAQRLEGCTPGQIAREPLLGDPLAWKRWFDAAGVTATIAPVATFAETGLMLQAAEYDFGLALSRGLFAVDALSAGRLARLSDVVAHHDTTQRYFLVYPPSLRVWPPLVCLREWLMEELSASRAVLKALGIVG
jgi:LysR family glycine cleavage system transcriptional activator